MANVWGVHTTDDHLFLDHNLIAIGWHEFGDLSKAGKTRDDFKEHYAKAYPNESKQAVATCVGMLYRFLYEVQVGDYVVFPSKFNREINIGIIQSEYIYNTGGNTPYVQQRKVKWLKHLPRTAFSQGALHEVGSALTLFSIKNYADEFLSALDKGFKKEVIDPIDSEEVALTAEGIIESTKDYVIKELSRKLKGYDLENFIEDLLQAMGYRTTLSPHGGDRGIDITAYKDELPPRILVQVKSGDGDITEKTLQSLKGAMKEGDYGLFITLADYTKNAKNYLEITPIIRGINGSELVDLILKYYDKLNDKNRKLIPLKMVYIPVPEEENS